MSVIIRSLFVLFIYLFGSQISIAAEANRYLSLGVGHVAVLDDGIDDPVVVKLEFRFRPQSQWLLAPAVGIARSGNDASFVFVIVERDFKFSNQWFLTPSFGVGSFDDGRDVKLGNELEFRSGINLSYQFDGDVRIGIALFHLSNGGISDTNPGTEPMFLAVSFPL